MSDVINGVASEYEMPREPKFYPDDSKLPRTNCNIPMPSVKPPASNGDRICDTCNKEDVCMYKDECTKVVSDIQDILDIAPHLVVADVKCKKWSGKVVNYR